MQPFVDLFQRDRSLACRCGLVEFGIHSGVDFASCAVVDVPRVQSDGLGHPSETGSVCTRGVDQTAAEVNALQGGTRGLPDSEGPVDLPGLHGGAGCGVQAELSGNGLTHRVPEGLLQYLDDHACGAAQGLRRAGQALCGGAFGGSGGLGEGLGRRSGVTNGLCGEDRTERAHGVEHLLAGRLVPSWVTEGPIGRCARQG